MARGVLEATRPGQFSRISGLAAGGDCAGADALANIAIPAASVITIERRTAMRAPVLGGAIMWHGFAAQATSPLCHRIPAKWSNRASNWPRTLSYLRHPEVPAHHTTHTSRLTRACAGPRRMRPRKSDSFWCSTNWAVALRGSPGRKRPGEHLRVTEECQRARKAIAAPTKSKK